VRRRKGPTRVAERKAVGSRAKREEDGVGLDRAQKALEKQPHIVLDGELGVGGQQLHHKVEQRLREPCSKARLAWHGERGAAEMPSEPPCRARAERVPDFPSCRVRVP